MAETGPKGSPPGVKVKGPAPTSLLFQYLSQGVSLEAEVEARRGPEAGSSAHVPAACAWAWAVRLQVLRSGQLLGSCPLARAVLSTAPWDRGTCRPLRAGPLLWESGRGVRGAGSTLSQS